MLQSIKRAHRLDSQNPRLHSCLIRFHGSVEAARRDSTMAEAVLQVIEREAASMFAGCDAHELNRKYLEQYGDSLAAVLEGAKMMYHLERDRKSQEAALKLVTSVTESNRTKDADARVSIFLFLLKRWY